MGYDTKKERRELEREIESENKAKRAVEAHNDYLFKQLWPSLYKKYSGGHIDEKLALFASSSSSVLTANLQPVYDYLKAKKYICVFIGKYENPNPEKKNKKAEFEYYKNLFSFFGRCKCLYIDDTFLPAYAITPRKGQKIIQLWHFCASTTSWGYLEYSHRDKKREIIDKYPLHSTYTAVSVASDAVKPIFASALKCKEEIVHAWGCPKTDVYFDKSFLGSARAKVIKSIPNLSSRIDGRKIILYAPDPRGSSDTDRAICASPDYMMLKRQLGENYIIIRRLSQEVYDVERKIEYFKAFLGDFVFDVPPTVPDDVLLAAADILVTDYSSLIFDYSLLERPIFFYAFDIKVYRREHDLSLKHEEEIPGPFVGDSAELADEILKADEFFDSKSVRHFKSKYMAGCNGHSSGRIAHYTIMKPSGENR
ncbi:MAG: CDP-glycerol glycerophosphotransferase family protein [Clostridiales bacterium]|nr:CDP-glycerol glycerophosphotransferase family protein [Clostridiales bacterium]